MYQQTADYYSEKNDRKIIDLIILAGYLPIGFVHEMESEKQHEQGIRINLAFRWFLRLDLSNAVPVSSAFEQVMLQCNNKGYATGHTTLSDYIEIFFYLFQIDSLVFAG